MGPYLELRPFTEFDPKLLGGALYQIVRRPANRRLLRDFPGLRRAYGSREIAVQSVIARQRRTRSGAYEATAILGGRSQADMGIIGVQSFMQATIPAGNGEGPNLAIWLDFLREPYLRRIGVELMWLRMKRLIADERFTGRPWTVIRPANKASLSVWRHDGYSWGGFDALDSPLPYPDVDGVKARRQLFVCRKSLVQMR